MSNEQTPVEDTSDDLDTFSSTFFGQSEDTKEPASSEEVETVDDDVEDAKDTHSEIEDDTLADEDDTEEVEAEAKPEDPKPKKNRFQERIDELTGKAREAERREADVKKQLDAILAKLEQNENPKSTATPTTIEDTGPSPEDINEDGTEKYPLGEFDPQYIRDLTRHTIQQEREAVKAQDAAETQDKEIENQRAALQADWEGKLGPAQERYPDFREKGEELISSFDGIDPAYGEYLTSTIMSLDYGTDVLYYLANNVDEAQKIVNSGATKATVALGRLEAKFAVAAEEKQNRPKVSQAPTPPVHVNKGSSVAHAEVPDDTDDLDAFASKLFNKKRRN